MLTSNRLGYENKGEKLRREMKVEVEEQGWGGKGREGT